MEFSARHNGSVSFRLGNYLVRHPRQRSKIFLNVQSTTTNKSYEYKNGNWIKVATTSENETTTKSNKITDNGDYNIPNNDSTGFNDVSVDVAGGVEFNKINVFVPRSSFHVDVINNTDSTIVETKWEYSSCTFVNPLKKFTCGESAGLKIVFTPTNDYDGFYKRLGGKISFSGNTVTPGDGYAYEAAIDFMGNTYTMTKLYNAEGVLITIE